MGKANESFWSTYKSRQISASEAASGGRASEFANIHAGINE